MEIDKKNTINKDFTDLNQYSSVIDDFESIDVKQDWLTVKSKIQNIKKNEIRKYRKKQFTIFYKIAAAVIIIFGISFFIYNLDVFNSSNLIIAATQDSKKNVFLPDGSTVFLNVNSELSYPEKFSRKSRSVDLKGEAFFNIKENHNKPFKINTGDVVTEIIGTSFSLRRTKSETIIKVVSGNVLFYNRNDEKKILLNKDEAAVYSFGSVKKIKNIDKNFLAWKTGILVFDETNIADVFETLERHYNIDILTDSLTDKNITLTSTFDNQSISDVMNEIKIVTGIYFKFENEKILLYQ